MAALGIKNRGLAGSLGLLSVLLFVISLLIFGNLNAEFNFVEDFVSKLGAIGEPYATWWNILGFGLVGMLLIGFGIAYGGILKDNLTGILLALFGVGFALISIPMDMANSESSVSKAHIVAVCLALAFWLFGLARISQNGITERKTRRRANVTALLIVMAMLGFVFNFWSMPLTHRLVFFVVFSWTAMTSLELLLIRQEFKPIQD